MGLPAPVIVFGILKVVWSFTIELMAWQVNRTNLVPRIEYFGRDWGKVRRIKNIHRNLFPDSWTRDISWGLRVAQIALFAWITIGIILGYMYPVN